MQDFCSCVTSLASLAWSNILRHDRFAGLPVFSFSESVMAVTYLSSSSYYGLDLSRIIVLRST